MSNEVQVDQVSADQVSEGQVSSDQVLEDLVFADQVSVDEISADLTTGQMNEINHSMHIGYDIAIQSEPFLSKVLGERFNPK